MYSPSIFPFTHQSARPRVIGQRRVARIDLDPRDEKSFASGSRLGDEWTDVARWRVTRYQPYFQACSDNTSVAPGVH